MYEWSEYVEIHYVKIWKDYGRAKISALEEEEEILCTEEHML